MTKRRKRVRKKKPPIKERLRLDDNQIAALDLGAKMLRTRLSEVIDECKKEQAEGKPKALRATGKEAYVGARNRFRHTRKHPLFAGDLARKLMHEDFEGLPARMLQLMRIPGQRRMFQLCVEITAHYYDILPYRTGMNNLYQFYPQDVITSMVKAMLNTVALLVDLYRRNCIDCFEYLLTGYDKLREFVLKIAKQVKGNGSPASISKAARNVWITLPNISTRDLYDKIKNNSARNTFKREQFMRQIMAAYDKEVKKLVTDLS